MATDTNPSKNFDLGLVFSNTFKAIGENLATFGILAALAVAPGAVLTFLATGTNPFVQANFQNLASSTIWTYAIAILASSLLSFIFSCILQAALIHGTVATLNGQRATFSDCLATGLRSFLPVAGIGLLMALGFIGGFILLILPGLILLVGWAVAIPVRVVEHKRVFEVFGRSWSLTSGHRWMIFGIYFIVAIGSGILQAAISPLAGISLAAARPQGVSIVYVIAAALVRIVLAMFNATLAGTMYYELRAIKEGIGPEALASVFD